MSYHVSQSLIDKLSGSENWHSWKQEILIVLQSVDSDGIVCGDEKEPADVNGKQEWMMKNKRAYTIMWVCTDPKYRFLYEGSKLGSVIFEKLKNIFERSIFSRRVQLRKSFYGTTHDPSQPIDLYIQAILTGKQRLVNIGVTVSDTEVKDVILMNLDPKFDDVKSRLISRAKEPTLEEVKCILLASAEVVKIKTEKIMFPSLWDTVKPSSGEGSDDEVLTEFNWAEMDKEE